MRLLFLIFAVCSSLTQQEAVLNLCSGINYALSLEHLEAAFYRAVNSMYNTDGDYAKISSKNGDKSVVRARLAEIGAHEDAHVVALTNLLNSLSALIPGVSGCEPVSECTYNFNLGTTKNNKKDINTVLATAELLESTGVKAYDGAIASLVQCTALSVDGSVQDATIVTAAATIATVEARHDAYLRTLIQLDPFPNTFDPTLTPNQVLCAARQFVVNPSTCPVFNTASC